MSRLCINNTPPKTEIAILSAINGTYILNDDAYQLIEKCHNKINGHGGVKRTMHKFKLLKVKWPNMRLDVKTFIRECPCCQKMSQIKVPIQAYKYVTSTYRPMERSKKRSIGT
jgi:Integrase zinc binding domain